MKKIVFTTLVSLFILVALSLTVYLFNLNNYSVSQIGKYSFLIIDEKIAEHEKGDLVIVERNPNSEIEVGDEIFFYNTSSEEEIVSYGKVNKAEEITETEATYTLNNNHSISSQYVIGKNDTAIAMSNMGSVVSFMSSRWGFLFLIIFPVLMLLVYQIYLLIKELKKEA